MPNLSLYPLRPKQAASLHSGPLLPVVTARCVPLPPWVVERAPRRPGRGDPGGGAPTLSCDLETLPLWSRSSAVKACQMALSSSSFKPPMAAAVLPRLPRWPCNPPGTLTPLDLSGPRCSHLTPAGPAPAHPRLLGASPGQRAGAGTRAGGRLCPPIPVRMPRPLPWLGP